MQPARLLILAVILCCLGQSTLNSLAQTRDEKVRQDRSTVRADGQWIYNDLNLALAEALGNILTFRTRSIGPYSLDATRTPTDSCSHSVLP